MIDTITYNLMYVRDYSLLSILQLSANSYAASFPWCCWDLTGARTIRLGFDPFTVNSKRVLSVFLYSQYTIFPLLTIVSNGHMIILCLKMTEQGGSTWLRLIS